MSNINDETMKRVNELRKRKAEVESMIDSAKGVMQAVAALSVSPCVLKEYKDVDNEFFYESRGRYKDLVKQLRQYADIMDEMIRLL